MCWFCVLYGQSKSIDEVQEIDGVAIIFIINFNI